MNNKKKAAWEEIMKESIFEAAVTVLKQYGLEGLRMNRVAKTAEVAIGTLYNYFKDKDTLILYVLNTMLEPYLNALHRVYESHTTGPKKLEAYYKKTSQIVKNQKFLFKIIADAQVYVIQKADQQKLEQDFKQATTQIIKKIIEQGIREGLIRKCNPLLAAKLINGALTSLILEKIESDDPNTSFEKDISESLHIFFRGMIPEN